MTNGQIEDWQRQSLQMQYQVLEQDSRSMVSTHWTVVSIFIGINTALLGAVAYMLNNGNYSNNTQWIILFLGIAFLAIFFFLCLWLNRVNYLVDRNRALMQQIEQLLGMLTQANDTKEKRKQQRTNNKCKFFPCIPCDGALPVKAIYLIFGLLWISAIAAAFIIDC